jgi:hypothetical protein
MAISYHFLLTKSVTKTALNLVADSVAEIHRPPGTCVMKITTLPPQNKPVYQIKRLSTKVCVQFPDIIISDITREK